MKNKNTALLICLFLIAVISAGLGRYSLFSDFAELRENPFLADLILDLRLPRIATAVLAGISLTIAGYVMQTVFKNPLADPGVMGVSQAAGFGAALGILYFGQSPLIIKVFSFGFSLLALFLVILFTSRLKLKRILGLVLAGIAVSALFSAGLGLLKYLADPIDQLPNIVFWLLGSISGANWNSFYLLTLITFPLIIFFFIYRWRLNVHMLDEKVTFSLGIGKSWELNLVLAAAVLLTSAIISTTGIIGWVGLIIPNYGHLIAGPHAARSMVFSGIAGGIFLLICDDLSRILLPGEIPIGIFTAFIGSFLFVLLFWKKRDFLYS